MLHSWFETIAFIRFLRIVIPYGDFPQMRHENLQTIICPGQHHHRCFQIYVEFHVDHKVSIIWWTVRCLWDGITSWWVAWEGLFHWTASASAPWWCNVWEGEGATVEGGREPWVHVEWLCQSFSSVEKFIMKLQRDSRPIAVNYFVYLDCTKPNAISVAAVRIERAKFAKYCLNSVAHDCSSTKNCGECVYHKDAILMVISAISKAKTSQTPPSPATPHTYHSPHYHPNSVQL